MAAGQGTSRRPDCRHLLRGGGCPAGAAAVSLSGAHPGSASDRAAGLELLSSVVYGGSGGLSGQNPALQSGTFPLPQGHLPDPAGHPEDGSVQNASLTLGRYSGYLQRTAQTNRGRSGGEYGDDAGPSAAGDDLQSAGTGMRSRVSVHAGLAHGIAESGVHSCGHGFYDGHYGQLWQGLSGCGGDDPGYERDHCGVHRRH